MNIEVSVRSDDSNKERGDLLESLTAEFLKAQGYDVVEKLRTIGAELDLLCKHDVTGRTVYVECKAYRNPLGAEWLKKILGTVVSMEYQEGWLISTGSFGSDAKGFQENWERKQPNERQRLSFYTPDRVIDYFIRTKIIKSPPQGKVEELVKNEDSIGNWTLLVTPYGKYWAITCLIAGIPEGVLLYSAKTGELIDDQQTLRNVAKTDTSIQALDFDHVLKLKGKVDHFEPNRVVEVQHGDSWADYRPARPEDFVGRHEVQNRIIHFLNDIALKKTRTRVVAITGDSGMGKSSLISKLRERLRNQRYKKKFYIYAVDVRAAKNASYILSALLECLHNALERNFGDKEVASLRITNFSSPLESPSIKTYLDSLERKGQVVCLVFDQFEELYSKSDLLSVFEVAYNLFVSVTAAQSNLVLGFAWKSDNTVPQNHPAYFMWHMLADNRFQQELRRFTFDEASKAITLLEKELSVKLSSNLRRQLLENTQGYPWWLKKLSIHVYEQIRSGVSQSDLVDNALDVESLFNKDMQNLSSAEIACLQYIAENAPIEWFNVLDIAGNEIIQSLISKRLVIKSGEKLTIYWDIFREYLISKKVPSIPLNYLPRYQSVNTALMVAQQLSKDTKSTYESIGKSMHLNVSTIDNVVHDLIMLGVAKGEHSEATLDEGIENATTENILRRIRQTLKNHAVVLYLRKLEKGAIIKQSEMIAILKEVNPTAQHGEKTWRIYAKRIIQWLTATGYLIPTPEGWKVEDLGDVNADFAKVSVGYYKEEHFFIGDSSPAKAVESLEWLLANPGQTWFDFQEHGFRNAAIAVRNLEIITNVKGEYVLTEKYKGSRSGTEIVWKAASADKALSVARDFLKKNPSASGKELGEFLNNKFERNWSNASIRRTGNSIRQWARWLLVSETSGKISKPPGKRGRKQEDFYQAQLI